MAMQTIKNGGFIAEEIGKINDNFTEIQNDYAKKTAIPNVPTKTSDLTNDSGFITSAANGQVPAVVMRKSGSNYGIALVDVQVVGTNVVITSDEAFEGYVMLV